MKSGNLNFLEPSGPLQACNGTALPYNNLLKAMLKSHVYFFVVVPVLSAVNECFSCDSNCKPYFDDRQLDAYNL